MEKQVSAKTYCKQRWHLEEEVCSARNISTEPTRGGCPVFSFHELYKSGVSDEPIQLLVTMAANYGQSIWEITTKEIDHRKSMEKSKLKKLETCPCLGPSLTRVFFRARAQVALLVMLGMLLLCCVAYHSQVRLATSRAPIWSTFRPETCPCQALLRRALFRRPWQLAYKRPCWWCCCCIVQYRMQK